MKSRGADTVWPILFALAVFFIQPVTAAETKASKAAAASTAKVQADWETLVKNARKEGKVVIYGSAIGDATDPLKNAFKSKYGISIEFLQGRGGEIVQKLLAERRAGLYLADLGIGGTSTYFQVVAPAKIVVPLEPLLALSEVTDKAKWLGGKYPFVDDKKQLLALGATKSQYVCINTSMVKPNEITTYENLLDQKWKGKITMNDPGLTGMGNQWFTYMMVVVYGKEKGAEYMKKLVAQEPGVLRDERLQVEWIAKGKYPLGVGTKSTIVESFVNAGAAIKYISLKEGAPLGSGSVNLYAFDRAPHPNASKLFVNWVLSKEAQDIITRTSGFPSMRMDVSKAGYDPSLLPGPGDALLGEDFKIAAGEMQKVAAEIFKDLIK